jgi:autotransporter passenger strand-loop-strand repeat protein
MFFLKFVSRRTAMTQQTSSGFSALYSLCRASNGSAAMIEGAVRSMALSSGGAGYGGRTGGTAVIDGGIAVSGVEIAAVSRAVAEVWQSSGGSRILFEAKLKQRLGRVDGGRKFLTALSLACVLQTTVAPLTAWAAIDVSSGQTSTGQTIGSGGSDTQMNVSSGGTANSTTVNSGGYLNVYSSGTANSTVVNAGGLEAVMFGGSATGTTLNSGGRQNVQSGGTANSTSVNLGGIMDIMSSGAATSTVVNAGLK